MKGQLQSKATLQLSTAMLAALVWTTSPVLAQNTRGSATGPTTAKGYSHPDQFVLVRAARAAA